MAERMPRLYLTADAALPDDTRLWAALQEISGGTWGGSVFGTDSILRVIEAGRIALAPRVSQGSADTLAVRPSDSRLNYR